MTHNLDNHPVMELRNSSQALHEQSLFAHRQATNGAERARKASESLAELDLEKAFRQLRQMVAMVGGKSAHADAADANANAANVVTFPGHRMAQAAE